MKYVYKVRVRTEFSKNLEVAPIVHFWWLRTVQNKFKAINLTFAKTL